ncbi:MAG: hypothetical protein IT205_06515 [Fimbriimonadaceae bacterium]|nr:hypothetical protein [Fimbriimonadaceae bacterium]
MRRQWPILVLLFAPVIILWRCLFLGEVIGPWAEVRAFSPWSELPPNRPFDVLQMDSALQFYVWRDLVFDSWRHFQVPWWNPYSFGGAPLLANSQSGALYPPHVLVGILQIPTPIGITLLAWFHLALAGLGVYALGRRMGGDEWAACLGGLSFTLSAFMISWTGLASVISTVAWIPWCLWACVGLLERKLSPMWLAAFASLLLLAGHLQFAAFGIMATVVFWIVGVWEYRPGWQSSARAAMALVAGIVIASPQLVPVLRYSSLSHRKASPTMEGWAAYHASGTQWWEWASMGSGDLLGSPSKWAPGQVSAFWPALVKPGGNYAESAVAVGVVVLILGVGALFKRPKGGFALGAVALFGFLIASASPVAQALYFGLPGWSATGSPGRAGVLVVLALCALAGSSTKVESFNPKEVGHWILPILLAAGGAMALFVRGGSLPTWVHLPPDQFAVIFRSSFGTSGMVVIAVVSALLVLLAILPNYRRHLPLACSVCGLVVLVPGLLSAPLRTGHVPPPPEGVAAGARVAIINQQWSLFAQPKALMPPNLAALYRIKEIGGYDSLISRDIVERLRSLNGGQDPAPAENGNMMFIKDPSRITKAQADEIWTIAPVPGWEHRLIGSVGSAYRYRVE